MYVQVQCSLYQKYFGYAANAYYLMILVLLMFFFEAKCNYLLPVMNLAVKFDTQAGDRFSYEIIFMSILFEELPIKDPLSIVLKVEISNMGIRAFCQQIMNLYL